MHSQREGAELQIRGTWSAGPGDDQARFLADLRALRDSAALGYDELAARAHYPSDVLKEAENGPCLPGLPILTAFVRACDGDVLDWEERWRRLNPEVADDPSLPVRPAGASAAAVAGARAGVGVAPPDVYDPERIRAALRGGQTRSGQPSRRANRRGHPGPSFGRRPLESPQQEADSGASLNNGASWSANSGWDTTADPTITSANGNHSAEHGSRGPFDAVFTVIPDSAERTEPAQAEDFSWLKKSTPESESADDGFGWSGQADHGRTAQPTDSGFAWPERADTGLAAQPEANPAPSEPAVTERIPRHQADGLTAQERTDFWAKPATSASADLQLPTAAARAEETAIGGRPGLRRPTPRRPRPRNPLTGLRPTPLPGRPSRPPGRQSRPPGRRSRSARRDPPLRRPSASRITAARTGSSRCGCWWSSSSPRSSAARWCCCLSNVLARRFAAVGGGRVAVLGRGGDLRFGTDGIDGPQRIDEAGPGDSGSEHGAQGVVCRRSASARARRRAARGGCQRLRCR